ncbi:MAG TPA: hypothetical protein VMK65_11740 [Longimicrobiales bacterium]|nr:hypothetical protein [Longimicrobiales bacterium]
MRVAREPRIPRRRSTLFPWMLGLVLLVLLLWLVSSLTDAGELDSAREADVHASAWTAAPALG